jgi:hypothetical protein
MNHADRDPRSRLPAPGGFRSTADGSGDPADGRPRPPGAAMKVVRPVVLSSAKSGSTRVSSPKMPTVSESDSIDRVLERAFAPLHKLALGVAVGLTAALLVFAITVFHVIAHPVGFPLALLSQYFYGYDTSWRGAFIGLWWGFVSGFAAGWFLAFMRNFAVATWLLFVRAKASLKQTRDFLDHI